MAETQEEQDEDDDLALLFHAPAHPISAFKDRTDWQVIPIDHCSARYSHSYVITMGRAFIVVTLNFICFLRFAPAGHLQDNGEVGPGPMFPYEDLRQRWDDYGQPIDLDHFLHPPTRQDPFHNPDSMVHTHISKQTCLIDLTLR